MPRLRFAPGRLATTRQFRVRIETSNVDALRLTLEDAGYDVLGTDPARSTVDVAVSRGELAGLRSRGLFIVSVERGHPLEARQPKREASTSTELTATAAAVSAGYLNLDGIVARLNAIAAAYPAIAQVVDVTATYNTPPTFEGRHIYALKISDNVSVDEDEPAMLIAATHHAREISTPVIALEAADRLTAGYDSDPRITDAVNSHEIWIAPVWNPDGYNYVFTTNNLWRKNRRVFSNGVGVDQNRNYSQGWGTSCAGSTSVGSETYKGPSAASEAETRTMMTWSQTERFAKIIDYHSYGREVLYAYRCLSHPFTAWMQQQAAALSLVSGYGGQTRVPSAEGEHPQWQFATLGAYAFLIETHTEFQPSYASALNEAATVWPGILSVLERPMSVSGSRHRRGHRRTAGREGRASRGRVLARGNQQQRRRIRLVSPVPAAWNIRRPVLARRLRPCRPPRHRHRLVCRDHRRAVVAGDRGVRGHVRDRQGMDAKPERHRHRDQWGLGAGRPAGDVLERRQAAGHDGERCERSRHGAPLGFLVRKLRPRWRTHLDAVPGNRPPDRGGALTLTFSYYLAHGTNSSSADYLRVSVVGTTQSIVLQELGNVSNDNAVWATATVDLSAFLPARRSVFSSRPPMRPARAWSRPRLMT